MYKESDIDRISAEFEPLIKHYARKCRSEVERQEMEAELWGFLWDLIKSGKAISQRYIAVSIRNRYIWYSTKVQKKYAAEVELKDYNGFHNDDDFVEKIAMRDLLDKLGIKQRKAVYLRHVSGLSFAEIAKKQKCTRQAVYGLEKRGIEKLRKMLEDDYEHIRQSQIKQENE